MPSLRITIIDHERGESRQQRFGASPLRIGRDSSNELHLPFLFVSRWQAVIRFDRERATLFDLGSQNPLRLGGERIARGAKVAIRGTMTVTLGSLELRIEHRPDEDAPTLRVIGGPGDPREPMAIDGELCSDPSLPREGTAADRARASHRAHAAIRRLRGLHEALRASQEAWKSGLARELAAFDESDGDRAARTMLRREIDAWGAGEGAFVGGPRTSEGPSAVSFASELALHLTPRSQPPQTVEAARRFGERVVKALQVLAATQVELQQVWAREREELGVADDSHEGDDASPIGVDAAALIEALLDPHGLSDITPERVIDAGVGLQEHVRALIRSAREAARQLAERLSPAAIAGAEQELWPGSGRARWQRYCEHYHELCGDDGARIGGVYRALLIEAYRRALDSGARWSRRAVR